MCQVALGREPGDKTRDNQEKSLRLVPETVFKQSRGCFPRNNNSKTARNNSLLRFSLLLSLSVVNVYEKMGKVQIKIHKEPPDHKMLIKVGLCATSITCYTMYSRWRCAQHPQSIPGPRSTPITLYLSALSTRLRTLPTLNTLAPTLRPHHTPTARSAYPPQHPHSTPSAPFMHNVAGKFRTVPHRSAPQ